MTAPKQPLLARIADEFQGAYPHAFRLRSDAEDAARIALAVCGTDGVTAAETQALVERVARAICQAMPHAWVDTCRPSAPIPDGCLLPFDEEPCDGRVLARAAVAACRAESLREALRDVCHWTKNIPQSKFPTHHHYEAFVEAYLTATALLAELDGQPLGDA